MSGEKLLNAIETIHGAGMDAALWPQALEAVTQLVGGVGTTLEVIARDGFRHLAFYAWGIPKPEEIAYLSHYAALSPRYPAEVLRQPAGEINWDYRVLDETAIDRSLFYTKFLAALDMRYFVGGIVKTAPSEIGAFAVQRSARHGHVDKPQIELMRRLAPHVSQALEVTRRLRVAAAVQHSFERALDWLLDGAALIDGDGAVRYANAALQAMIRADDGIAIRQHGIAFRDSSARRQFTAAQRAIAQLQNGDARGGGSDFPAARPSGAPAYLVSVRPLSARNGAGASDSGNAVALLLVHDPLIGHRTTTNILRDMFGLTGAESDLALALQSGIAIRDYARRRGISINTAYTHFYRIKDKTGCRAMPELIRTLNDLKVLTLAVGANGA